MQIKIFNIPVLGGETLADEMNIFLRSKKILQIREHLVNNEKEGVFWCFCIRYAADEAAAERERIKMDYRKVLDEEAFKRFSALRQIRKQVAEEDAVPAYAVLTDYELAELAKLETITPEALKGVKGIGEKKLEKYGNRFLTDLPDEESK